MILGFWSDFIAGWIAGICATVVGHPMDTIKVRQQILNIPMVFTVVNTWKTEGIRGYYKGMLFPLITMGPSNSLFFGVYGNVIKILQDDHTGKKVRVNYEEEGFYKHVCIAGVCAGFVQTMFNCPVEVVKTVLQVHTEGKGWKKHYNPPYDGMVAALRGIYKERGFFGFYNGLVALICRDVAICGPYTMMYEYFTHLPYLHNGALKEGLSGGTAGVISWMFTIPQDVVKSRLQADNPRTPKYTGFIDCIKKTYKSGGVLIFYSGIVPVMIRAFPVNCVAFLTYESVLQCIDRFGKSS